MRTWKVTYNLQSNSYVEADKFTMSEGGVARFYLNDETLVAALSDVLHVIPYPTKQMSFQRGHTWRTESVIGFD